MNFTSTDDILPIRPHESLYHYVPTEWICILFVALYSLTTLTHVVQAGLRRLWWLFPTAVLAGILEILGWSGRLWSSKAPLMLDPYLMQITCTVIAPTPLVAANFVVLGRIITQLGTHFSRMSAEWYTILFCSCDIVALVIQSVGGGIASFAVQTGRDPTKGVNLIRAGIVFQLAAIIAYVVLAAEFMTRYCTNKPIQRRDGVLHDRPDKPDMQLRMKLMISGMVFMTILLFIRSVYQTIELADGWTGRIISTQVYFNVLDGGAIALAMFTLNVFHPGFLLDYTPESSRDIDNEEKPAKPSLADNE